LTSTIQFISQNESENESCGDGLETPAAGLTTSLRTDLVHLRHEFTTIFALTRRQSSRSNFIVSHCNSSVARYGK